MAELTADVRPDILDRAMWYDSPNVEVWWPSRRELEEQTRERRMDYARNTVRPMGVTS